MEKTKFELEFILNTSTPILYKCMTTPSGLSEWFADNVNVKGDNYTFFWDGSEETAQMIRNKKGESVRFQWEDDEGEDYYFELLIRVDPMTKQVALIVTDFAEEDEIEDAKLLWENSITSLRQSIGC
ncbi:MAG: SRPBCC domain-containing protein [Flavobacteriales bacterium]|nr:SRPBCC domain-containing protein [Flavobacteriales bacterium]